MRFRWHLLVFLGLFAAQWAAFPADVRRVAPWVGDAAENLSIGQNLARGRGYRFDWDDPAFRAAFARQNATGAYDRILARHGSYPTLSRPPLMPLLLAGCVRACPRIDNVFWTWRVLDMALCAAAGSLLCGTAVATRRGRRGGVLLGILAIAVFLLDPIRWRNVPAWWNEGLACDLTAVGCWLLVDGRQALGTPARYRIVAGATLGLLCLDRAVFVLLLPPLSLLLASAEGERRWAGRCRRAMVIAAIAVAVQLPWWARNVAIVGGRAVPLGTQGGFNLPDEYGPVALHTRGNWDGRGIRDAWLQPGRPSPAVPGYTPDDLERVGGGDARWGALLVAFTCTSTASELAVADVGTRAAVAWIGDHAAEVPGLFVAKAWTMTEDHRPLLAGIAVVVALGFWRSSADRRLLRRLAAWTVAYGVAVAATHVLGDRFLVPGLPPMYLAVAIGAGALIRR